MRKEHALNRWALIIKLEHRLAVETRHHRSTNFPIFHLPFVFVMFFFFFSLFSFLPPLFLFSPCSAGDSWMAANGRVESPQPLSLPDIHSETWCSATETRSWGGTTGNKSCSERIHLAPTCAFTALGKFPPRINFIIRWAGLRLQLLIIRWGNCFICGSIAAWTEIS